MLSLVFGGGLLLGGNVIADGASVTSTGADTVSQTEQVEALQTQAKQLSEQVQAYLADQAAKNVEPAVQVKPVEKKTLSQDELDRIETQVQEIAAKTEVIKTEVAQIVLMRQISSKIAYLQEEVNAMKMAEAAGAVSEAAANNEAAGAAAESGETLAETATAGNSDVESQIAAIKDKIKDLTAQYEQQKAAENAGDVQEITPEVQCEGGVCSASVDIKPAETAATTEANNDSNTGFWQSVGNFFKNIFTF